MTQINSSPKLALLETFELVFPLLPAPIYWMDNEGRVLAINDECLKAMGATREMVLGKTSYDFYPHDTAEHILKHNQEVIRTGQILSQEERIDDITTGVERFLTSIKAPLHDDVGNVIGIIGTSIDITDRKEAERLKQEKLEEQEKFTKTVLQVVHDIRSPLMVIDILAGEASHFPEEERIMLRNSVQRINDIASNLMNSYKSRGAEKEAQQLPLFVFLNRLFSEKQLQYAKQNIEFKLQIEDSAYFAFTLFELGALQRILSNLINNALEAMEGKGRIVLELKLSSPVIPAKAGIQSEPCDSDLRIPGCQPTLARQEGFEHKILLSIRDNGKGIPPEVLSKIGTQGMSYAKAGTGLGLSHAIETIRKHKGYLKIESTLGQGTTVTLELPLIEAPNWFAQSLTVSENTILIIIDDDPSIHYLWDKKFVDLKLQNTVHHFYFAKELDEWVIENSSLLKQVILLCDNELIGSDCNGRELIEKYHSQVQDTLLVTSYYAFHDLVPDLTRLQTRLLPKELVMQLTIIF
jgi:PAS domain S-box-containing protein